MYTYYIHGLISGFFFANGERLNNILFVTTKYNKNDINYIYLKHK